MAPKNSDGSAVGRGLDLTQLRTFLTVYRAGSLTEAARRLGLAQPTVTGQIRALEQQLDRQLFERLPRGVAPTAIAKDLAARISAPMDALVAVADRDPTTPAEPVQLGGPAELLAVRILPVLAPLVADGVRLRVTAGLADDLLDGLRAGRFDLVLSAVRPRGRSVLATPLMDEEFVLVAAPAWRDRLDPVDDPAVLDGVPLITYAEDLPILRRYWRHVFRQRLDAPPALVVPDLRGVLAATVAGAGVTVLPRYLCAEELRAGSVVALREPEDPPINTGFLAERANSTLGPEAVRVRDAIIRAAREW
ncbi:LysR family transcriptional regulator [Micromonospora krabiensis]|uniref:DNA-binding transcriptional regulator, LysR family n=1 Tax=Micromonospora krabiensis TaxID=307121 RepID=A0A1C3MZL5_9ACTN|nr:LysR family transcriptional regulator [Micromonospora krabiensis]SBV25770.1 DNA-binding transcriptional regulator, LysR family [Micromonospora krabiensis]